MAKKPAPKKLPPWLEKQDEAEMPPKKMPPKTVKKGPPKKTVPAKPGCK